MPIYEYGCQKCGAHTEAFQKVSDKPLTKCRSCGGKLEKQWSQTSFQLKGSGWYVTDYAGKKTPATDGKKEEAKKESTEATSGGDKQTSSEKKSTTTEKTSTPKPVTTPTSGKD